MCAMCGHHATKSSMGVHMSNENLGYEWRMGPVSHEPDEDSTKVTIRETVPYMFVNDVKIFDAAHPGVLLGCVNGTSIKVISQNTARRILQKNSRVTDDVLKAAIFNAVMGVRTRTATVVTVKTYEFQGVEYATLVESQAAQIAFLI